MSDWELNFKLDSSSPSFLRWNSGKVAGWLDSGGYYMVTLAGKRYMVSRIVWEISNDTQLGEDEVDHWDGNTQNNLPTNLRRVSHAINCKNRKKRLDNKTGYVGVSKQDSGGNRFYVVGQFNLNGKIVRKRWSLLRFTHDEAINLANEWRKAQIALADDGYTERHVNGN